MQEGSGNNENKELSTRVNSARLPDYLGKLVRLACRTLKVRLLSLCSAIVFGKVSDRCPFLLFPRWTETQ